MKNISTKKIIVIIATGLLASIALALIVSLTMLKKEYNAFEEASIKANYEEVTDINQETIKSQEKIETIEYNLLSGWNLVAFPVKTLSFSTAAGLINDIANNGGFVSTVSMWNGDRWEEYVHSGEKQYGQDFAIVPGKAYFLRSHETYTWKVVGVALDQALTIELSKGWNAVGFSQETNQSAENIIDQINTNKPTAQEIDYWLSGSWDVFVKRVYSSENIKTYGNNFTIDPSKGYMVNLTEAAILELKK